MTIDPYARYQTHLTIDQMYPDQPDHRCACGCGKVLTGRQRRWAGAECRTRAANLFLIVKGDMRVIRDALFWRDGCVCARCQRLVPEWDADHIVPVHRGGGGCDLDNFQTLCPPCHRQKTAEDRIVFGDLKPAP